MSESISPIYSTLFSQFRQFGLSISPAELHGLMTGLLCTGAQPDDGQWLNLVADYGHQGQAFSKEAQTELKTLFSSTALELADADDALNFTFLLPDDDDADLLEKAESVSEWLNSFLSGLGLMGISTQHVSDEMQEVLGDIEAMAQLGVDPEGDLDDQSDLLEQVLDHTKMCVFACYLEWVKGKLAEDEETPQILH